MAVLINDISVIEAFRILTMLLLGSPGFQAVTHKQLFTSVEDIKEGLPTSRQRIGRFSFSGD